MKTYDTLEEAYKDCFGQLLGIASKHIYNRDFAVDAVHDAFTKAVEYCARKKGRKISGFILAREVTRACRRLNKYSVEVPAGTMRETNETEE